jgi:hypothetical protein
MSQNLVVFSWFLEESPIALTVLTELVEPLANPVGIYEGVEWDESTRAITRNKYKSIGARISAVHEATRNEIL